MTKKKQIEQYDHSDKARVNNPPVGLVTPESDPDKGKKKYSYDSHLDPQLQWAGKTEHTSFDIDTVSLHVHERIDPKTIIESVKKAPSAQTESLFDDQRPLREAIDFYKHKEGWTNRLVSGDSLLVMNSLLEKEGMGSKVQMIYFDPPYGIKYGSNFQPFVNKRDVKDGKDEDLSSEPETIKAFRDTWQLGIHSYLSYLRDRLLLAREMLTESGSIFLQISDENVHLVRNLMDEVFGVENFVSMIAFSRTSARGTGKKSIDAVNDYLVQYCKEKSQVKYRKLFKAIDEKSTDKEMLPFCYVELKDGSRRAMTAEERKNPRMLPQGARRYRLTALSSQTKSDSSSFAFEWEGKEYKPHANRGWTCSRQSLEILAKKKRLQSSGNFLCYLNFHNERPGVPFTNQWTDTGSIVGEKHYVVETATKIVQRCLLMATDPGDLVLDPTCGSGTTAFVAEQWGRRWITCDTSRVAVTLAKQRLMTAVFDYYKLAKPNVGVGSGFEYSTVPHVTLKSIANDEPPATETLYDKPKKDNNRVRITGPFTVEAVPAPYAKSTDELKPQPKEETRKQISWRDELLRTGIRLKGGQKMYFSSIEPLSNAYKYIQAEAETKEDTPKRVLIVFGPEYAPLEQRTVESAYQEARRTKPNILLFCAFQFDPEAGKDIDELSPEKAGMQLLRVNMNTDLLTEDLKKGSRSSDSFFLVGRPDVQIHKQDGTIQVEVLGFDYYNLKTSTLESGHADKIAVWLLDADYDGRSLFPSQIFFPMAGTKEGWGRLAKNLNAQIDEEKIEAFRGTKSLPFKPGKRIAVKIIDDRGIESLRIVDISI